METLSSPHRNEAQGKLYLERTIKWKFLLSTLMLRKQPSINGTKAKDLKPFIHRRLDQQDAGDWRCLVENYEKDVVLAHILHMDGTRSQSDRDEANIWEAADLLSHFQCSKAHKFLQSNGLGDHLEEPIVEQNELAAPKTKNTIIICL